MSGLRVAVPKGAIFADALSALEAAGLPAGVVRENGRRLIYRAGNTEFIVGRSGSTEDRLGVVTASAFALPALRCGMTDGAVAKA